MFSAILGLMKGTTRWKKASKCKSLMKHLKLRLSIQKSRRIAVIRQSRADIAQLLRKGQHAIALARVEQLYQDQIRLSAYDQLDGFCDCVSENLPQISRPSECKLGVEVVEAVSSLIFGGSRCGELPELNSIRCLFKHHFGRKFERINVELLPGNTVNSQLTHNLDSNYSVARHVKLQLLQEIKEEEEYYSISSSMSPSQESNSIIRPGIKLQHNEDPSHDFRDQIQGSKFEEMMLKSS